MNLNKSYDFFNPNEVNGRIHIVGCGSVGSSIAENLARYGITNITLWDFDKVESHNIVNQMFTNKHIGMSKVEALKDIIVEINPDAESHIELKPEGWNGQMLTGYVFLAVDNIEIRKEIVKKNFNNLNIKAMFDFRTELEGAQHYAARWNNIKEKQAFLESMNFSHEEASAETQVSACGTVLGVATTVRIISELGVNNFVYFVKNGDIKKMVIFFGNQFAIDAF